MIPLTDCYSDIWRAAHPAWFRSAGRFVALAAAALAAAALWLPHPAADVQTYLLVGAGIALSTGVLFLLWDERLEVDWQARRYRYRRGVLPFAHWREGRLEEFSGAAFSVQERLDDYGRPVPLFSFLLQGDSKTLPLFRRWGDPVAEETARHLSERMERPFEVTEPASGAGNSPVSRIAATGLIWAGLAGVVVLMFWPILSGARPLWRPSPPESQRSGPRRMLGFFGVGLQLYQQQKYVEAEEAFRKAIDADPNEGQNYNMLAYALAEQKKLDLALKAAYDAIKRAPESGMILDTVAEMHERRKEWTTAERYYKMALLHMESMDTAETHAKLGRTLLSLGRPKEAVPHLQRAARTNTNPWGYLAQRLLQENNLPLSDGPALPNGGEGYGRTMGP